MLVWIVLGILILLLLERVIHYRRLFLEERSKKSSVLVKHGKTMEHLVPFTKDFPGDPRRFRFIGDPIDGVLFGDEEITFLEFKSGDSNLSPTQKRIRKMVEEKKIEWKEIRA